MNKMSTERRAQVLTSLVEGNSIASTCRMQKANKITVLRLLADAGSLAADYHDLTVRNLETRRVQLDEIWSFTYCKAQNLNKDNYNPERGDTWTWCSIDAESKLIINWLVGNRGGEAANQFVGDLAERLNDRVQLTSDEFAAYKMPVRKAFGADVDYAQLVKEYSSPRDEHARYSPPICIAAHRKVVTGAPDRKHIHTAYAERSNLSMRMGMRRFTRLTNGFSKLLDNHKHMVALYFLNYNFIRKHQTIKTTPAVAAGIADKPWTMEDFVVMLEREEAFLGERLSDYKPAASKKQNGQFDASF